MCDPYTKKQYEIFTAIQNEMQQYRLADKRREHMESINHGHKFYIGGMKCDCGLSEWNYRESLFNDNIKMCPYIYGTPKLTEC